MAGLTSEVAALLAILLPSRVATGSRCTERRRETRSHKNTPCPAAAGWSGSASGRAAPPPPAWPLPREHPSTRFLRQAQLKFVRRRVSGRRPAPTPHQRAVLLTLARHAPADQELASLRRGWLRWKGLEAVGLRRSDRPLVQELRVWMRCSRIHRHCCVARDGSRDGQLGRALVSQGPLALPTSPPTDWRRTLGFELQIAWAGGWSLGWAAMVAIGQADFGERQPDYVSEEAWRWRSIAGNEEGGGSGGCGSPAARQQLTPGGSSSSGSQPAAMAGQRTRCCLRTCHIQGKFRGFRNLF